MANDLREGETLAKAQLLEARFIRTHRDLMALKSNARRVRAIPALRYLLIRHLEAKEDRVVRDLDRLIDEVSDPTQGSDPQKRLRLADLPESSRKA